jgi:hypothetical protein
MGIIPFFRPEMGQGPGGAEGAGNGQADLQPAAFKPFDNLLDQGFFAAEERSQAGDIEKEALRRIATLAADQGTELPALGSQRLQCLPIGRRIACLPLSLQERAGVRGHRRRRGN